MTNPDRTAFLAERQTGIGGSDVASLFNIGWGCRRRLWYQKTAAEPDYPRDETPIMTLGKILEPFFAKRYEEETGNQVDMAEVFLRHPEQPELCVHIDGWVLKEPAPPKGVCEIKSIGRGAWHKYRREGLPEDYILQLQHGMGIAGCTWGVFIVGCRDSGEVNHWEVDFSPAVFGEIRAESKLFWLAVKSGDTPEPLEDEFDKRCASCEYRRTCRGTHLINVPKGSDYVEDDSILALVMERIERSKIKKEIDALFEESTEALKAALGQRALVCTSRGDKVQYYEIEKKEYVVKAHKERPLRLYPPKE